ncbi:MAG TPA: molecular chaperone [Gammaproteobacteria bacterium]|nr:molecular chaperone [Gammaproteobacteria bacterium]
MAARFWRSLRRVVLPALFWGLLAPTAFAGSFQITPMLIEVPAGSSVATYTVRNTGDQPLDIQVSAVRWTQSHNQDHYAPAKHLLVVPQILSIPPGREQLVRVALRTARPAGEAAYRLHFKEIPPAPKAGFVGVQTALNMNLPLFFLPPDVETSYSARLSRGADGASVLVTIHNTGTRFVRIAQLTLTNSGGDRVGARGGPLYVLPGATRHWQISLERGTSRLANGTYRLTISGGGKQQARTLSLH